MNDPEKVSATWVKDLYGLVDELSNTTTEMIGMKPKDAIVLDQVPLVNRENYPPEETLPEDELYRYLSQPVKNMMIHDGLLMLQIAESFIDLTFSTSFYYFHKSLE